jgi:hypothetical protein
VFHAAKSIDASRLFGCGLPRVAWTDKVTARQHTLLLTQPQRDEILRAAREYESQGQ